MENRSQCSIVQWVDLLWLKFQNYISIEVLLVSGITIRHNDILSRIPRLTSIDCLPHHVKKVRVSNLSMIGSGRRMSSMIKHLSQIAKHRSTIILEVLTIISGITFGFPFLIGVQYVDAHNDLERANHSLQCSTNGAAMSFGLFDSPTPPNRTIRLLDEFDEGRIVYYVATLSQGPSDTDCSFEQGNMTITTPDGVKHDANPSGGWACIGGQTTDTVSPSDGTPCLDMRVSENSTAIPYAVHLMDRGRFEPGVWVAKVQYAAPVHASDQDGNVATAILSIASKRVLFTAPEFSEATLVVATTMAFFLALIPRIGRYIRSK